MQYSGCCALRPNVEGGFNDNVCMDVGYAVVPVRTCASYVQRNGLAIVVRLRGRWQMGD